MATLMDEAELGAALTEVKRSHPRTYGAGDTAEVRSAEISKSIITHSEMLRDAQTYGRVNLRDDNIGEVISRVNMFLDTCAQTATIPTFLGLSNYALGWSPQGLRKWLQRNGDTVVGMYLTKARNVIADIMLENGLRKSTSDVLTIFTLKNFHGFVNSDNPEVEPEEEERKTSTAIAEKYSDMDV